MAKYVWHCVIEAQTHFASGKRVKMRRQFDGSGDVYKAALACIMQRRDEGRPFIGCSVFLHTPLHNMELVLEDRYGVRVFQSVAPGEYGVFANMEELEALVNG